MPPGSDERHRGFAQTHFIYSDFHNRYYLKLVRIYQKIIVGQFFGHLHSDTFRLIYGDSGKSRSFFFFKKETIDVEIKCQKVFYQFLVFLKKIATAPEKNQSSKLQLIKKMS